MAAQLCLTLRYIYNVCVSSMYVCIMYVLVVCMYNVCISVWLLVVSDSALYI